MLLYQYTQTSPSMNPSSLTGTLPGGAGAITSGTQPYPGISAPSLETIQMEVTDVTAPSQLTAVAGQQTLGTPAAAGKLLVLDPFNSSFGQKFKLNTVFRQPLVGGQFGVVVKPANLQTVQQGGACVATAQGNISPGDKALVVTQGPVQAFVETTAGGSAISAGMALAADGAGNLTYAGAGPSAGTVVGIACGPVAVSISVPVLTNVYLGGY